MSRTIIYKLPEIGEAEEFAEISNAWRGAMFIWEALGRHYLHWDYVPLGHENEMQALWNLAKSPDVPLDYRLTLATTFDRAIVLRDDIPDVIDAFDAFETRFGSLNSSLWEQAAQLKKLAQDPTCYAVCWNQTSVTNAWMVYEPEQDEYRPYDLARDTGHWFLNKGTLINSETTQS